MRVGIIGLGLIGGSLARDLAARGHEIVGFDRSAATLRSARRAKVIVAAGSKNFNELRSCDACVLAVPVSAAAGLLGRAAPALADAAFITDVGSTKQSIVRAANRLGLAARFVGAHPLAGDHRAGWGASREGLFAGKPVYLTPSGRTSSQSIRKARALWASVGGRVVVADAGEHDTLMAAISHLPQVASLGLAMYLGDRRIPRSVLGRGGRDMTRLAASNVDVWAAILTDNRANIAPAIARYRKALGMIETAVRAGDSQAIRHLVALTGKWAGPGSD